MDFDPGFHEEMYDEGFEDGYEEAEEDLEDSEDPEIEYDGDGDVVAAAAVGAGFGYHMAQDERESLEEGLEEEERSKVKIEKVPLHARHSSIKGGSPFERWARDVQGGRKKITDPLEFTPEEEDKILANEVVEE